MSAETTKQTMKGSFIDRSSELEDEARKKISLESAQKAFWETLEKNKEQLPLCVVEIEQKGLSSYRLMRKIEGKDKTIYYFHPDYLYQVEKEDECPRVNLIERSLGITEMESLIEGAQNTALEYESKNRLIIPKGFFVFRYQAQWAAGGQEDEEKTRVIAVRGSDIKEALKLVLYEINSARETVFWNFSASNSEGRCGIQILGDCYFQLFGLNERHYFYLDERYLLNNGRDFVLAGEGEEWQKTAGVFINTKTSFVSRRIFFFSEIFLDYVGKPVLFERDSTGDLKRLAVGIEEIKKVIKANN